MAVDMPKKPCYTKSCKSATAKRYANVAPEYPGILPSDTVDTFPCERSANNLLIERREMP